MIRETEFSAFSCGSSNINVVKGGFMPAKILLFEDEVSIRSVLSELLTDAGYEVVAVGDGVTGLAQYRKEQFDLVLLDIMMPRMDGYAVCRAIREGSDTPIIMLSSDCFDTIHIKFPAKIHNVYIDRLFLTTKIIAPHPV